ncbi:RHS Repeat protein [compost metagenome]
MRGIRPKRAKRMRLLFTIFTVVIVSSLASISASAVQYEYDDLDRLTKAGTEGGETIHYQYDAGGNLLNVTKSTNTEGKQTASNKAGVQIWQGWKPYFTAGVNAQYSLVHNAEEVHSKPAVEDSVYAVSPEPSVTLDVYGAVTVEHYPVQQMIANSSVAGGANIYKDFETKGKVSYTISGLIQTEQLQHSVAQVIVNYYNAKDQLIGYENVVNVRTTSDWMDFGKELLTPVEAVKARVHLQMLILEADGSGTANYAAVSFEPHQVP